jgi:hypothetical protein
MPLISLDQFVDKVLTAKKPVKIYRSPGGEVIYTVEPGLNVGRVYSWVGGNDKPLFFMFYLPAPNDKKEKEQAKKPTSEKIFDYVKKYALWAGLAYAAFLVFKETRKK